ncbi:MAG TPA: phosphatase PAP2 family protein [Candidatus Angelobacter sp.]|jgi:membrane-associated PAP2 superfamily phosphatase|nr:phosphatase PAP2 family protein [Candidatus Angelobacter sp.]
MGFLRRHLSLSLLLWATIMAAPPSGMAQQSQGTDPQQVEHRQEATTSEQKPDPHPDTNTSVEDKEVTWRSLPGNFLHDQKQIWLFPKRLVQGQHVLPTLAVAGTTTALIAMDPHVMPYFQTHARNLDDLNDTFDSTITSAEVLAVPAGFLVAGYLRNDQHEIGTAILAGEAYANSAVVDLAMKAVTRRKRPSDVPPGGDFHDTFFSGGKSPFHGSSFPSGHAAGVFSVATVVATRYRRHRWVPWLAYGFAGVISASRITTSSHFPSDVFMGAALGYTITRYTVLKPR